eukprot:5454292-Alexandrium_andersonii.AAC.1
MPLGGGGGGRARRGGDCVAERRGVPAVQRPDAELSEDRCNDRLARVRSLFSNRPSEDPPRAAIGKT